MVRKGQIINQFNYRAKAKSLILWLLGLIDAISRARLFKQSESVLVFHEISDTPSKMSTSFSTSTSTALLNALIDQYENSSWMSTLRLKFTFDDGFLLKAKELDRLENLKIPTTFFVNALTIDTGIDCQIMRNEKWYGEEKYFNLSPNEIRNMFVSFKKEFKEQDLVLLQGPRQNWASIQDLCRRKFTIGDHFLIHIDLRFCPKQVIQMFTKESVSLFIQNGVRVKEFALPYGKGNKSELHEILSFEFDKIYGGSAWSLLSNRNGCIPRVQISEASSSILKLRGELLLNRLVQSVSRLLWSKAI